METAETLVTDYLNTPLGWVRLTADERGLRSCDFVTKPGKAQGMNAVLSRSKKEFGEYFAGKRKSFTIPFSRGGTEFQNAVWHQIESVPFGQRMSYGEIARSIKRPRAVRAVGTAVGANPLPVVVPCHRIVSSGPVDAGHFSAGRWRKTWLLRHEQEGE